MGPVPMSACCAKFAKSTFHLTQMVHSLEGELEALQGLLLGTGLSSGGAAGDAAAPSGEGEAEAWQRGGDSSGGEEQEGARGRRRRSGGARRRGGA